MKKLKEEHTSMKKLAFLALALAMVLSVTACAPAAPTSTTPAAEAPDAPAADAPSGEKPIPTIAFVPKVIGQAWWDYTRDSGVLAWAEETGYEVRYVGPTEVDAAAQVQIMSDIVAQGVDILCFSPNDPAAVENICKEARDQGIIVISTEASGMTNIDYNVEAFDEAGFGGFMMDILAEQMGEEGEWVQTVGSMTMESQVNWADAALARQQEKFPDMVLVPDARVADGSDAERAYELAKEMLQKYPNLKGFQTNGSFGAPGVCRAIKELDATGVYVVGTSIPSEVSEYLHDGVMIAGALWDPAIAAKAMLNLGLKMYYGEEIVDGMDLGIEGYNNIKIVGRVIEGAGMIAITKENVDSFTF